MFYVKIPVTNSKGNSSAKVIKRLSDDGLKLNITAVYTLKQVKKIIKCVNKNSHTIISIFLEECPMLAKIQFR